MNKWFAGCGNVKLFELHKKGIRDAQTDRQTKSSIELLAAIKNSSI